MIELRGVGIRNGSFELFGIDLAVPTGEYAILMGKTGSGKTTILESVCGLKKVTAGRILIDGRDVTRLKPAERGIGFVPQDGALFETMTVRRNLGYALRLRRWPRQKAAERIEELAALLGIGELLDRRPQGLSGGERQRVALGRALAFHPSTLCLDEPLSALDEDTHEDLCRLLKKAQRMTGVTALHITHNRREAEALADRLFVLRGGRVVLLETRTDGWSPSQDSGGKESE